MARPAKHKNSKVVTVTLNADDLEVVNYLLKPMTISVSSFISAYISEYADAIRGYGLNTETSKDWTLGELQRVFGFLQLRLEEKKAEAFTVRQVELPGLEEKV